MYLSDLIPPGAETGAGLALQHRGRYLFDLAGPRRYASSSGATFYAGIGGHLEPGETWLACAQREAREELGCDVSIRPAACTAYIARDGAWRLLPVNDEPRPLCIYELWNPPNAPWNQRGQGYIYYIVVYEATLDEAIEPQPRDVDGILWLTPALVARTARASMTLASLRESGAQLAMRDPFPEYWTVRPFGTAHALSILWGRGPEGGCAGGTALAAADFPVPTAPPGSHCPLWAEGKLAGRALRPGILEERKPGEGSGTRRNDGPPGFVASLP